MEAYKMGIDPYEPEEYNGRSVSLPTTDCQVVQKATRTFTVYQQQLLRGIDKSKMLVTIAPINLGKSTSK